MFGARQATNIIQFVGTHGIITSTDWQTLRVSRHAGVHEPGPKAPEGLTVLTLETPKTGYQRDTTALLEHFADLISGAADPTRPHACTLEQGAAVIAVMEAMVRSHEEGRRIALTEVL
jgi:predicted dehydrogenase